VGRQAGRRIGRPLAKSVFSNCVSCSSLKTTTAEDGLPSVVTELSQEGEEDKDKEKEEEEEEEDSNFDEMTPKPKLVT
jgi:hypothetical protein